ncbi:MAG: protein translocase subunit SecF [Treponema sp.]|nr:protein translocase subunit SecF [Treponema sp.]
MKKTLSFNKGFLPCAIISLVLIIAGVVGFFTKGINFGIDYKPGHIEEIRIATPVADLSYTGDAKVTVDISSTKLDVVISGASVTNETKTFDFVTYPTVQSLASAMNQIQGVKMNVTNGSFDASRLFMNSAVTNQLSETVTYLYPLGASTVSIDEVRGALAGVESISIKQLGDGVDVSYQIRVGVSEGGEQASVLNSINDKLYSKFGKANVAIVKTDFIGSSSSKSNTIKSVIMFALTLLLIWVYAAIRFHWDFALGSIVALLHDTCIMIAFICWSQLEFSATVLAAVLTIIGYSINATVVILDRVRYNLKYMPEAKNFNEILNKALSDTLLRSILTTVTTLFAVVSLYVFTTGAIKDFALAMIVGLISGMYSSIFISSGFISLCRKNWKPEFGVHHSAKTAAKDTE